MITAASFSSVRREPFSRKRPSSTAAMKMSTIPAAISIATWSRRLPIVGSSCGPTWAMTSGQAKRRRKRCGIAGVCTTGPACLEFSLGGDSAFLRERDR